MIKPRFFLGLAAFGSVLGTTVPTHAQPKPIQVEAADLTRPITGTASWASPQTVVEPMRYLRRAAFRLTDGRSEAIVVPSLGRVMSYGLLGGENWLWNSPEPVVNYGGWNNWGGDKTWPAPQSDWGRFGDNNKTWPPPAAWDAMPHSAQVIKDNKLGLALRTTSAVALGIDARLIREYRFENGEFVVTQIIEKRKGAPEKIAIWNIAQVKFTDAIYMPLNADSVYKNNWVWQSAKLPEANVRNVSDTLLEIRPATYKQGKHPKIGADSDVAALLAVKNGMALRLRASRPNGAYPENTPLMVYVNGFASEPYAELELSSPILEFKAGSRWKHTVRWSLIALKNQGIDNADLHFEAEALLREK
ncbi:MAG TPA: hypothetical protein VF681_02115 [Abditibacteriaceae bacterium]|jgi:hypothetical protein